MNIIQDRLKNLMVTNFGMDADQFDPHATFGDLDVDSIALVELAVASEEEFGVKIGDDEFTPQHTLVTAAELLAGKGVPVR
jgi:acyl carrier protein